MIDLRQALENLKLNKKPTNPNSHILVVDALNTFLRSFTMMNKHSSEGQHIGGIVGFLKSIGYAIKLTNPNKVILVFDGVGGSDSRKNLLPSYKGNRNTGKVMNNKIYSNKDDESDSINNQMSRLIEYLHILPVNIICVDGIEADDTISYIKRKYSPNSDNEKITIMSSDKDFLQLIDEKTQVYSPTKKKIYMNDSDLYDELNLNPINYIIYKTLLGDKSDNIPGVSGLGSVKLFKLFPELKDEKLFTLKDVFTKCNELKDENALYWRILERKKQLEINFQIMDLNSFIISDGNIEFIEEKLNNVLPSLNYGIFNIMIKLDNIEKFIPNSQNWLIQCFGSLHTNK